MRKVWLFASALLAFLNFVKSQELARTLYSPRYDNLDIDTILGSNRLVSNYVDCLLSRKPCPPEGKDLKRILPEALRTKCARCSPIQKENALKIITRLYFDYPDQYRALRERWDPSGEYHRRFEEYLRGLQFNQIGGNGATAPAGPTTGNGGGGGGGSNTVDSGNDRPAPPPVLVNRFGEDADQARPTFAPAPVPVTTTTTQRPTTTERQTRPVTRQTTTRNTQRTTTRFITRVPQTPPPRTTTFKTPQRPPTNQPIPTAPQQPLAPPSPPQIYPTIILQQPQAPPRATPTTTRPLYVPTRPPYVPTEPTPRTQYDTTPDSIIDHFFVPPSQAANQPLPASPIVGLWNQLGTKIADTADAIAGMLKKTVDVLVTSHIQSHQRALRRI
ncbi:mucin-2-like isoform X1 [Anopheles bellator]|uniref:mucin-2-like isoform X1 n=1 Tax=Anopheles bellator TaxID=139047 RepID=UPI0026474D44|nr:mucin-2-like isoform X1 [Anopheles bellator]